MKILGIDFADVSEQYLRAALVVSLMSVWMLVGLFYYLNRYTKRDYFTAWTAAWLFYSLWLTITLIYQPQGSSPQAISPETISFKLQDRCLISRLLEGQYPRYKQLIPASNELTAMADKNILRGVQEKNGNIIKGL